MATEEDDAARPRRAYRAKLIDNDGRVEMTVGIMASDDLDAFRQARDLALIYTVELWEGRRRVTTVQVERR